MRRKKKPSVSVGGADRPHSHHRTRGGDIFFCFSSRPSAAAATPSSTSSSAGAVAMRAPSTKSLLSPGRSRDTAAGPSLSSSLSRRLRSSGSVKGGQSPMFPAVVGGRRKGVAFEAAEPSSPKVTCIGQVRVKSKKKKAAAAAAAKGKASVMRSRSMRGSGREASFRRTEDVGGARECLPSRNQRWVYQLPVSICEALRAFGTEFNCFFPCGGRSLCSSSSSSRSFQGREGECGEKRSNSCGAVFARWLMAVPDSDEGKRREVVGVVVEDRRDREMEVVTNERIKREHLELEVETEKSEEVVMVVEKGEEKEEEEARVSICIPPRNALLLMRCRSDPVKMAALASRFWDSPAMQVRVEEEGEEEEDGVDENRDQCGERIEEAEGEDRDEVAAETEQACQQEVEGVEQSHGGGVLTEELMEASDGKEAKQEKVQLSPDEEKQNKDDDLIKGTAAEPVEAFGNAGSNQEERVAAAAEVENAHLEEKPEEKEMTNETRLEDREREKEEEKGRRSSSCSSARDKEERRSNRHASRSKEGGRRRSSASRERDRRRHSFSTEREVGRPSSGSEKEVRRASFSIEGKGRWSFSIDKDGLRLEEEAIVQEKKIKEDCSAEENGPKDNIEVQNSHSTGKDEECKEGKDGIRGQLQVEWPAGVKREEKKKSAELPDCLLLMMYEPKLSMEVSKETWVCSTDFLQWRVHHPNYRPRPPYKSAVAAATATAAAATTSFGTGDARVDEITKGEASKENTDDENNENKETVAPPPLPPPPAPPTLPDTEKKLRSNAVVLPTPAPAPAYGPFVLTRCKSEPMRSSAKLAPDACFWKERHRPIGATGIGF